MQLIEMESLFSKAILLKLIKFGIVGFSGMIVDFGITFLCKEKLKYARFFGVSLIGLGINTLILWLLTDKIKWNFYISKVGAIGITTIWNFLAKNYFTFA